MKVEHNLREFLRGLNDVEQQQVPFAGALALTRTAAAIQGRVRGELPKRFILRNSWVSKGIRTTKATKRHLEATVYSRDEFMLQHERGGTKTPRSGAHLTIPRGIRSGDREIVRRNKRPNALRGKPDVFKATIRGRLGLWQRVGPKKRGKYRRGIKLLYVFKPAVPLRPRFGFVATGEVVAARQWPTQFRDAFEYAMRTARRPAA